MVYVTRYGDGPTKNPYQSDPSDAGPQSRRVALTKRLGREVVAAMTDDQVSQKIIEIRRQEIQASCPLALLRTSEEVKLKIAEAKRLRKMGLKFRDIANQMGVPYTTARAWAEGRQAK